MILGTALFTGCVSEGIRFYVNPTISGKVFSNMENIDNEYFEGVRIIKSLDELIEFCEEWKHPAFNESAANYSSKESQEIRKYDEAYFAEKSLIIYGVIAPDAGPSYEVKSLTIEDNALIVNIKKTDLSEYYKAFYVETPWTFMIEVKNSQIQKATEIQSRLQ